MNLQFCATEPVNPLPAVVSRPPSPPPCTVRPYTKSVQGFYAPRETSRVPYWFVPAELLFRFEWPQAVLDRGMPNALSVRGITLNPGDITQPEFGNADHAAVAKKIARMLEVAGSRAANMSGREITLNALTQAPVFTPSVQMDML